MKITNKMRLRGCLFILTILSGCASSSEKEECPKTNIFDTPKTTIPECSQINSNHLAEGTSCIAKVNPKLKKTPVGLTVKSGEEYQVIALPNYWCDASRKNRPLCGEKGSIIMNVFSWKKRVENSLWFSVIAEVEDIVNGNLERRSQYDLCNTPKLEISTSGELIMYPNDAEGFFFYRDQFYDNNSGIIWLEIQRLKANNKVFPR
ncbi:MAG: hypothetical protein ACXWCG_11995 [Flavitalea sp.]